MSKSSSSISKTTTRPAISSKLKDNPFITKNRPTDAKLPPPAAKIVGNKNTIKPGVTRTSVSSSSSSSNGEQKKSLRTSIQRMVSSSSVSSNPWKPKASSSSKTAFGSTTKKLPPSPPSSNQRSSRSSLTPIPKTAAVPSCGAVNKKMPRRPSVTVQSDIAPEATAKSEGTPEMTATDDSDVQVPKTSGRPTSSSTTTNTSSARSTSSFSVGGCSTSSNDDGDHDDGVTKADYLAVGTGVQEDRAAISTDVSEQQDQGKLDPVQMTYELASAHAQLTAAKFNTAPSMQVAEDWQQKYECLMASADEIRGRILVETDIQRSIASVLKLSNKSDTDMLHELQTHTTNVDALCHEFFLTLAHAYDSRTRYLEHLAGTLARAPPTFARRDPDGSGAPTEREQALIQEIAELRSCRVDNGTSRGEKEALAEVGRLQNELGRLQEQIKELREVEDDQHRRIQDLTRTFQLREAEFELEIATLGQAQDAYAELRTAKAELEQALEESRKREGELEARQAEAIKQVEVREADLKEREIRPLQEALGQARQKEAELVARLEEAASAAEVAQALDQQQQEREAALIGKIEDHVGRIHTLETELEVLQAQMTRDAEERAILEAEAERVAKTKSGSEEELKQALATTSCESLRDMVGRLQVFAAAQEEFTRREAGMMLQQASVEAELGSLLKEYDRLTRNIHNSQLDRKHYEGQIQQLVREKQALDKELTDRRVKNGIGMDGQTMTLRKEFRQLMAKVKAEHERAMEKEAEERRAVENELRDLKHDLERKTWDRVTTAVQTGFVAYRRVV